MTSSATLLVLLLVDVAYSLSSLSESVTCFSSDIHHKADTRQIGDAAFDTQYDELYSEQEVHHEDPCNDVPEAMPVEVTCPYVSHTMAVGYTPSNTICSNDRVSFHFHTEGHNITSLHGSAFKAEFKISELHLNKHGIAKIAPGAFNYQSTIDSIFLRENNLSMISVGIFNSLTHLHTLDLSENQIVNISDDAFSSVPLRKLSLSRNKLTSLPDALFDIRFLDVSCNNIEQITPSLNFETAVLNVSNNNIKYFNTTYFPHLIELYLANNKLDQIELQASSILKLDVSNNTISEYPENLESLVMFNIGENKISHLPNKSIHGESLVELYLSQNNLTDIPSIFFKELTSLKILDLSGNKLSSFRFGTFDSLQSLAFLNISHNKFKTFPTYTFHAVKNLLYIYFSNNEITDLNVEDLFKHLPLLKTVDLRDNKLSCQNLLDTIHKFKERGVDFQRGAFTESDNIYGIKCNHSNDFSDTNRSESLKSYEDLRNGSFARYLETLNREPLTQSQKLLDRLLEMDKKQNEVLDQIITKLNVSGLETDIFQKSLLKNYSTGNADFVRQLEKIVNKTELTSDNYKELLTRYSDASNGIKSILLDILETDKKQNELLNRLTSEQSNKTGMSKNVSYSNNNLSMMEKFFNILNNTDQRQNEIMKTYSGLGADVKKALEALEKTQVNLGHFIEGVVNNNKQIGNNSYLALPDESFPNPNKAEALHSYSGESNSDRKYPVFIFMALLLTTMTILMFFLLYVLFYRVKYIVNTKPDVEMNQLLESKSDIVSN